MIRFLSSVYSKKVVTLTKQSMEAYHKRLLVPKRKLEAISNWMDLSIPHSNNYNLESKRIISAGRFGKEKGFDMLVKAYIPIVKLHPDWHLDIYGDGEMMPEVRKIVKENNLSDNIHLLGMRTDVLNRYQEYAMYVLPSHREGVPLVLLEAKLNHLPLVSFDILAGP